RASAVEPTTRDAPLPPLEDALFFGLVRSGERYVGAVVLDRADGEAPDRASGNRAHRHELPRLHDPAPFHAVSAGLCLVDQRRAEEEEGCHRRRQVDVRDTLAAAEREERPA